MPSFVRRALRFLVDRVLHPRLDAARAYDIWAKTYDEQSQNVLLFLDDQLLTSFLPSVPLEGKFVVDVGCGTGRHWARLLEGKPSRLVGYDASGGMLVRLREKFPHAEAHVVADHRLWNLAGESVDVLLSTLTLGYLPDSDAALAEWVRVLKPGGQLILTDLHPQIAQSGSRCFRAQDRTIHIRHYPHSLRSIRASAERHGLWPVEFGEKVVDDSVRELYEGQGAGGLYERLKGTPMMYGMHLRKG